MGTCFDAAEGWLLLAAAGCRYREGSDCKTNRCAADSELSDGQTSSDPPRGRARKPRWRCNLSLNIGPATEASTCTVNRDKHSTAESGAVTSVLYLKCLLDTLEYAWKYCMLCSFLCHMNDTASLSTVNQS